ncbi:MAG: fumarate hydratase C-terminal domain-containing protein [Anaerolineales bacterium]|nr:fumarate hydratase C-terminal domain-containing protein [Anaerolineales bacterium]
MRELNIPISPDTIRSLHTGDTVTLTGILATGRDTVHKWMIDTFIRKTKTPGDDDLEVYEAIKPVFKESLIYHCGPVVSGLGTGDYKFVAAGPTTSIREEPYQSEVMHHFDMRGVIGKGGMGANTLQACQDVPAAYFHAIGGAAALIAESVEEVVGVYKLDFGVPEAIWVLKVKEFPVVVTMDSHGKSIHDEVEQASKIKLAKLLEES